MERATRESWQITPLPEQREQLEIRQLLSPFEAEKLGRGCIPRSMDERWFVYQERDWVYFHRSWTGHCIFAIRLAADGDGFAVAEAWVSRDPAQFGSADAASDAEMLRNLIRSVIWERR